MGAGSSLSLAKKPIDLASETGRGECTSFSNAGAHLKWHGVIPLALGGRVVRTDEPREFMGHSIRSHYPP